MKRSGASSTGRSGAEQKTVGLGCIVWQTGEAIALPFGAVYARGDALPQVRSPERLAALGGPAAQISHIQAVIVEALGDALAGMEPAVEDLSARSDEITSLTVVAANGKLAAVGAALLDLRITAMNVVPSP